MQSKDWIRLAYIGSILIIAITALIVAVFADPQPEKTGGIAVATACVAVLGTLASFYKKNGGS